MGSFGVTGWHDESTLEGPGVIVGRSGASFGVVSFVTAAYWPLNTTLFVSDFHGNDPRFVYYFLRNFDFSSFNSGSAQPSLNRNFVHPVAICVPDLEEQRSIAKILRVLDDKIELNRRMNRTLEEIARTLFRAWFVDFEGETDLVESELGPIPRGWEVAEVGEFVELAYGKALSKKVRRPGSFDVYGSGGRVGGHDTPLVEGPGVVVGRKGTVGSVYWVDRNFWPIDTTFYVIPKGPIRSLPWIYQRLLAMDLERLAADSAVPGVNRNAIYSQKWCVPKSDERVKEFDSVATLVMEKIRLNLDQSHTLDQLRDSLLPKLISGEIRVPEAEESLAEAM